MKKNVKDRDERAITRHVRKKCVARTTITKNKSMPTATHDASHFTVKAAIFTHCKK